MVIVNNNNNVGDGLAVTGAPGQNNSETEAMTTAMSIANNNYAKEN